MRRVLVLRPEPGAAATVKRARQLGLDAVSIPLFDIEPIQWTLPDARLFDALLLTSASAVQYGGEELGKLRDLPVYAVGEATAAAARDAGFSISGVGKGGVDRLLGTIPVELKLLHLCGEDRTARSHGRPAITPVTVYRAIAIAAPDIGAFSGIALIHSPRAGRRFAELAWDRSSIAVAAISSAAAEAVGTGWAAVEAAAEPNDEALLALAARLCNKPATQ